MSVLGEHLSWMLVKGIDDRIFDTPAVEVLHVKQKSCNVSVACNSSRIHVPKLRQDTSSGKALYLCTKMKRRRFLTRLAYNLLRYKVT